MIARGLIEEVRPDFDAMAPRDAPDDAHRLIEDPTPPTRPEALERDRKASGTGYRKKRDGGSRVTSEGCFGRSLEYFRSAAEPTPAEVFTRQVVDDVFGQKLHHLARIP